MKLKELKNLCTYNVIYINYLAIYMCSQTLLMARLCFKMQTEHKTHRAVFTRVSIVSVFVYNNQIIGQSAMGYCASKPMGKSRVF